MPSFCDPARVGGWFVYRASLQLQSRVALRRLGSGARRKSAASASRASAAAPPNRRRCRAESQGGTEGIKISRRAFGEARSGQRPK